MIQLERVFGKDCRQMTIDELEEALKWALAQLSLIDGMTA